MATQDHEAGSGRGRRRDASRTDAILQATLELLLTRGFDDIRIQDVAQHAGVGLATIYRRWASKSELLASVIKQMALVEHLERTGDPQQDLLGLIQAQTEMMQQYPELLPGFVRVIRTDPNIAQAVRDLLLGEAFRDVLTQLAPEHPQLDFIMELLPATLIYRALLGEPMEPEVLAHNIMGLLHPGTS